MTTTQSSSVFHEIMINLFDPNATAFGVLTFLAEAMEDQQKLRIQAIDASVFRHDDSMTRILRKFFMTDRLLVSTTVDNHGFTYLRSATACYAWFRPDPAWIAVVVGPDFALERTPYPGVVLMPTPTPTLHVQGALHRRDNVARFYYLPSAYATLHALQHDLRAAELLSDPHCELDCRVGVCAHALAYVRDNLDPYTSVFTDPRFGLCARGDGEEKVCRLMRALHPLDAFSLRRFDTHCTLYQYSDTGEATLYLIHSVLDGNNHPTFILTKRLRPLYDQPTGPAGVRCCEVVVGPTCV
jgi:hypothetical protein